MRIIKITGNKGSGKSEALKTIAAAHDGDVVGCSTVMAALPLLTKKISALNLNTFIDDVTADDLPKLQKLARIYPDNFRMYVAGENL